MRTNRLGINSARLLALGTPSAGRTRILAAAAEVTEGNNELFIFRRESGEWRIHRYLFSTNQPRA